MGILSSIFTARSTANDPGPWGAGMVRYGNGTAFGQASNDEAMRLSAVFACLRLVSEAIATMPLELFTGAADGTRKPAPSTPDYLSFQPPEVSLIDYLSQVMLSLLSDGNSFVATPRDDLGVPLTLVVIDPTKVKVRQDKYGVIDYEVGGESYSTFDLMHIKGMCMPGALRGLSPLSYAREVADLGLAAQRFGAGFFNNGAMPSGIIQAPGDFSKASAERAAGLWDSRHRGVSNAGRVGVLTGGATFTQVSISPEQSQFLATRAFGVADIARFFGVPPHLIADASNSTSWGSGLQEQGQAFGQYSLRNWVKRIEDAHDRLLTTHGKPRQFIKLNMDALLRADTAERYAAYAIGLHSEFLTVNEVRKLEDLPPIPGGDLPTGGFRPASPFGPPADSLTAVVAPPPGTEAPGAPPPAAPAAVATRSLDDLPPAGPVVTFANGAIAVNVRGTDAPQVYVDSPRIDVHVPTPPPVPLIEKTVERNDRGEITRTIEREIPADE